MQNRTWNTWAKVHLTEICSWFRPLGGDGGLGVDRNAKVWLQCHEWAVYTYPHTRMLAHTYYDNSGQKQASLVLAEPGGLRGALSSSGGKLLRQKKTEGGLWVRGGDWWREERKSGPQIRKREEEQGENRDIVMEKMRISTDLVDCVYTVIYKSVCCR